MAGWFRLDVMLPAISGQALHARLSGLGCLRVILVTLGAFGGHVPKRRYGVKCDLS